MTARDVAEIFKKADQSIGGAEALLQKNLAGFAVSRAYYAMYYVAEALLASRGLSFSKHSAVISAFGRQFSKAGAFDSKFHQYLIEASEKRQVGDYVFGEEIQASDARTQIDRAKEFLEVARQYLKR